MENLEYIINNPSKGETYDNIEDTIADQMRRFTTTMSNSKNPVEDLKMVVALGFDLWKTCGEKVCEDTNMILCHIIRGLNPDMVKRAKRTWFRNTTRSN